MPEAVSMSIEKSYQRYDERDECEVIGWYFEGILRQTFDYTQYPFDHKNIWIRLWHQDFDQHVILVPDLVSYNKSLSPQSLPGIEREIVLSGWKSERSYFDYKHHSYNTDFGLRGYVGQIDYPELNFNFELSRTFKDAFITNLVPLTVVATMLFAMLLLITQDPVQRDIFAFNISGLIGACSALFFVVLLAHIQLRQEIPARTIIYLEYFYFTMYAAILGVSINAYLFVSNIRIPLIEVEDNLIPKLLFCPMILGVLLVITLWRFY